MAITVDSKPLLCVVHVTMAITVLVDVDRAINISNNTSDDNEKNNIESGQRQQQQQ
jgi:hypothetical protein